MKILAPIDNIDELDGLISAGADEFYGGFIPYSWFREYGFINSLNRRNFLSAQIKGEEELSEIIKKLHSFGKPFYLALNQKFFLGEQYSLVLNFIKKAKELAVDGIIVADLGLVLSCQKEKIHLPVILSTLAQVMNSHAVKFYNNLGIKRMVLPRDLSLNEMKKIIKNNPSVEFEVFILIGKCFNLEGFCTYEHSNPNRVWPCNQKYNITYNNLDSLKNEVTEQIDLWSKVKRTDACGLCALGYLKKIGVRGLKIVGRGASCERKKKSVGSVKFLLNYLDNKNFSDKEFYNLTMKKYEEIFGHICEEANCYFPEVRVKNG